MKTIFKTIIIASALIMAAGCKGGADKKTVVAEQEVVPTVSVT